MQDRGIAFGRHSVVIGREPVAAPLVDVIAHVVEAVLVRFGGLPARAGIPMIGAALGVVGQGLRRRVAPG